MKSEELNIIVEKIEEVKNLFQSGQKVLPLLEEVFKFIGDIKPIITEIKEGLKDNVDNKLPIATENLYKVTESSETATVEILNKVDVLSLKTNELLDINSKLDENYNKLITKPLELLELLYTEIKNGNDLTNELPVLANAIKKIKEFEKDKIHALNNKSKDILSSISTDISDVMNDLQFQDITSQRLYAVSTLLNSIKDKLSEIVKFFNENEHLTGDKSFYKNIAFDPNMLNPNSEEEVNQDEIDDLFEPEDELIELDNISSENENFTEFEEEMNSDSEEDEDNNNEDISESKSLKPKFDESYLDIDGKEDEDDDDLLKYYKD